MIDRQHSLPLAKPARAGCVRIGSRNQLYIIVFQASSRDQMIPSERDLL
jgi:hypothetical protein